MANKLSETELATLRRQVFAFLDGVCFVGTCVMFGAMCESWWAGFFMFFALITWNRFK